METKVEEQIYIPKGAISLDSYKGMQLRLGVQGMPKSGKTYAALTFENPVVVSFDRGLISHVGRKDVVEIPLYDGKFCDTLVKRAGLQSPPNRKESFIKWLDTEALKLTSKQTLVIDGSTGIQTAFHIWYRQNPDVTSSGDENKFTQWRLKQEYFGEILTILKSLQCNVIYLAHESPDRDNKGNLNGQLRPLLTGQFVDELQSHFTDWFRAVVVAKPLEGKEDEFIKKYGIDRTTLNEWVKSTPPPSQSIYLWQTSGDTLAPGLGTSLVSCPKYILSGAQSVARYQRKIQ